MSTPRAYYNDFDPGACDWLPAAFPLAPKGHEGHRNRVMRLRGYGNAINPHAAAQFIRAFTDAVPEVAA